MVTTSTIETALTDLRAGRLVVVVDDPDRENEGDLIGCAATITPEQVAFMVRRLLPKAGEVSADAADALAVAICGAHHRPVAQQRLKA